MASRARGEKSGKQRILEYFLANLGRVIEGKEIQFVSGGASECKRRVRELRDEEGYEILSHKDRADLKPGQYLMETDKRRPVMPREISKETRAYVLDRNGYTCQSCGLAAGDPDPYASDRTVRLVMGHIVDKSKGGSDEPGNLRAICTNCNEGLQNAGITRPDLKQLLTQVRRGTVDDQLAVLRWLESKFATTKKMT
jgi:hypothetical protein